MKRLVCGLVSLLMLLGGGTIDLSYAENTEVQGYIQGLEVGIPFNYRNLTIVPVYSKRVRDKIDYLTLDEAIRRGFLTITEMDGGRVPQVRLTNNSNRFILLIAGEILSGCRQDRLVGRDALISPQAKDVILPVYCSEQGRWTSKSNTFYSEGHTATPAIRGQLYAKESQGEIWNGITVYAARCSVNSATSALQDVYRDRNMAGRMDSYVKQLEDLPRLDEDAVGVIVGLGDRVIGIDLFANPAVFSDIWSKLLKSYVALAISEGGETGSLTTRRAKDMLVEIYRNRFYRQPGLDLGDELQTNSSGMVCSALVYRQSLVHLAAFPREGSFSRGHIQDNNGRVPVIE